MLLKDLFDALNAGELRLNFMGDDVVGMENDDVKRKLLVLTRRGLTELHTRFDLRITQTNIPVIDGVDSYVLDTATYPDLLKIERVLVQIDGVWEPQPLNQKQNKYSYQSPNYRTLVLPSKLDIRPAEIMVEFRQDHPVLSDDVVYDPVEQVILELPQPFLEPLALFVAAKAHVANGAVDGIDAGAVLHAQYEMACQKLEAFNMDNDELEWRDAVYEDGWV